MEAKRDYPGQVTLWSFLAANTAVFSLWQGGARRSLHEHFTCSRWHLQRGSWHTLLTSCVSHQRPGHWLLNSCALWTVGHIAAERLSNSELAVLFACCGLGASGSHVFRHGQPVLGASGLLMGTLVATSFLQPERRLSVFPLPISFTLLQVSDVACVSNVVGLVATHCCQLPALQNVAWAAHVGGILSGVSVALAARTMGDLRFADAWCLRRQASKDWQDSLDRLDGVDLQKECWANMVACDTQATQDEQQMLIS